MAQPLRAADARQQARLTQTFVAVPGLHQLAITGPQPRVSFAASLIAVRFVPGRQRTHGHRPCAPCADVRYSEQAVQGVIYLDRAVSTLNVSGNNDMA